MLKNITLTADENLIRQAREKAQRADTTLNNAFRAWLQTFVAETNGPPTPRQEPRRIGLARGEFELPDDIDVHNEKIERLFTQGTSDDAPLA